MSKMKFIDEIVNTIISMSRFYMFDKPIYEDEFGVLGYIEAITISKNRARTYYMSVVAAFWELVG